MAMLILLDRSIKNNRNNAHIKTLNPIGIGNRIVQSGTVVILTRPIRQER